MNSPESPSSPTLYERMGGAPAIDSLIDALYERVQADPVLQSFFRNAPVGKIKLMQRHFFSAATGGPLTYSGRPLSEVHQPLNISRYEFDRYVSLLLETLKSEGICEEDSDLVLGKVQMYAGDIVKETYLG